MAKSQKTSPRKEIQAFILETLENSLGKVKEGMNEKKFNRNIRTAAKLIAADYKIVKEKPVKEKGKGKKEKIKKTKIPKQTTE